MHGKDNNCTRIYNFKFNVTDQLEDIDLDGRIQPGKHLSGRIRESAG